MSELTRVQKLLVSDRFELALRYIVIAVSLLFVGFPLYWMLIGAFQTAGALYGGVPSLLPTNFSLEAFTTLFATTNTIVYLQNSIIVTAIAVSLSTLISTLAGYGLARFQFRGRVGLARSILFTYMFSPIVLGIPLYIIFYQLSLLNTYISVALAHAAIATPFGIWLMWQFFQTIPISLEEAAWMQGAGYFQTFWDVVLPMAKPGYVATAIFAFAVSWSDFTLANLLLTDPSRYTLMVGAEQFLQRTSVGWGQRMATGVIITFPAVLIIMFLQDYLLQGFDI